jgi:hypothetical protein
LTSFPRSGNTFLRALVEKSSGYLTSSVYCDKRLSNTFTSECNKTNRWLIKTHFPVNTLIHWPDPQKNFHKYDRYIHLIRNPFDAIVSYHHFHMTTSHTELLKDKERFRKSLLKRIDWYISKYKSHYLYWRNVPFYGIMVRYEDLTKNTRSELEKVLLFLNITVNKNVLDCALRDRDFAYSKSRSTDFYGYEVMGKDISELIVKRLGKIICQSGYHEMFTRINITCKSFETIVDFNVTEIREKLLNHSKT